MLQNKNLIEKFSEKFILHKNINIELKKVFFKFEYVYACFCSFTGALILNNYQESIFHLIGKPNYEVDEEFMGEEQSINIALIQERQKKLKKSQEFIINTLIKLKDEIYLLIHEPAAQTILLNHESEGKTKNFDIYNGLYSASLISTINNCIKNLNILFAKNKKLFSLISKKETKNTIIEKTFGKAYEASSDSDEKLVFQIHKDQTKMEQIILLLRYISLLDAEDILVWLTNTLLMQKKS